MKIGKINIVVKQGNIASENVDCIVVPEFDSCASYGGVGYAICAAGMEAGLEAYDEEVSKKPLAFGEELITPSGKEGVWLAHVATAGAKADEQFYCVTKAVLQALISANDVGIKTIAVPELGTGIIGTLTPEQSAKAIFLAVENFNAIRNEDTTIQELRFVVYQGSTEPAEKVLAEKTYSEAKPEKGQKEFDICEWLKEIYEQHLNA